MKQFSGFQKGVNLGGWFSQCDCTEEHYDSFILPEDLNVVRGWGCDHVRVPVDYTLRRYVKKPGGARPGFVIYTNQRTLFVKPAQEKTSV